MKAAAASSAIPIPITRRAPAGSASKGSSASSVPHAPVIGSLREPSGLEMPALDLPPSSPEAFSLVRDPRGAATSGQSAALANSIETAARSRVSSSAPPVSYIGKAQAPSAPLMSTSPTVLSVLQQRGGDDMLAQLRAQRAAPAGGPDAALGAASSAMHGLSLGDAFKKQEVGLPGAPDSGSGAAVGGAGLATLLRGGGSGSGGGAGAAAASGIAVAARGPAAPIVLSASFREAPIMGSWAPQATIAEGDDDEDAEGLASSDDEPRVGGGGGRRRGAPHRAPALPRRAPLGASTAEEDEDEDEDDEEERGGRRGARLQPPPARRGAPAPPQDDVLFDFNG